MTETVAVIGGVVVFIAIGAYIFWPRPIFVVVITPAGVQTKCGKVPAAFLEDCEWIAKDAQLHQGKIQGRYDAAGTRLTFSKDIPPMLHQRFRNAWNIHK